MGTMTFGTQAEKEESFRIMDASVEAGIDFFDTAEVYPVPPSEELAGLTETWMGEWLENVPRESVTIARRIPAVVVSEDEDVFSYRINQTKGFPVVIQ